MNDKGAMDSKRFDVLVAEMDVQKTEQTQFEGTSRIFYSGTLSSGQTASLLWCADKQALCVSER